MADFQSVGKVDSCMERLSRVVIGPAMICAAAFKNIGLSSSKPADLFASRLESSTSTSAVEIGVKEKPESSVGKVWVTRGGGPAGPGAEKDCVALMKW